MANELPHIRSQLEIEASPVTKARLADAARVRSRISNYAIPVIFVETTDDDEIREAFLRSNSEGLRISKADRAFSKASRLGLRRLVKSCGTHSLPALTASFHEPFKRRSASACFGRTFSTA